MNDQNPSKGERFLWTLAGFEPEVLQSCKIDRFHVSIISVLLMMVGIYAILAWTFFFSTVTTYWPLALIGGIFMGLFIVAFDRALIASLANGNTSIFSLSFRLGLAILLGVFLSQPMIHKIYQPEIQREAQILLDQKVLERKAELENIYASEIASLQKEKLDLESDLAIKLAALAEAEADFKAEMDGSGGTEQYGYSTVAKQKEKIMNRHAKEYELLQLSSSERIATLNESISSFENIITTETGLYKKSNMFAGTLLQAQALKSLLKKDTSNTLRNHFYLLSIILILIELSALISKLIFKLDDYKSKINLNQYREMRALEIEKALLAAKLETYYQLAHEADLASMEGFYQQSSEINEEKVTALLKEWTANKNGSFNGIWKAFEQRFLLSN